MTDEHAVRAALEMTRVFLGDLRQSLRVWADELGKPDRYWSDERYVTGFEDTFTGVDNLERAVHEALGRDLPDPDQPSPFE